MLHAKVLFAHRHWNIIFQKESNSHLNVLTLYTYCLKYMCKNYNSHYPGTLLKIILHPLIKFAIKFKPGWIAVIFFFFLIQKRIFWQKQDPLRIYCTPSGVRVYSRAETVIQYQISVRQGKFFHGICSITPFSLT